MYLVSPIAQIISSPSKTKLNKSETDGWMYSKLCLVNIFFLVTTVPVILESLFFLGGFFSKWCHICREKAFVG